MGRHVNIGWKADCDRRKERLVEYAKRNPDTPIGVLAKRFGTCKKTASKVKRAIIGQPSKPPPRIRPLVVPASIIEAEARKRERPKHRRVWCYVVDGYPPEPVAKVEKWRDGGRFEVVELSQ